MCGIAGLLDYNSALRPETSVATVERFCQHQKHRGPDAQGIWIDPNGRCVLGHRRLAIIDLDPRSNQPMMDETGRYILSFNGEIYNFQQLREELRNLGAKFKTTSDTEVLLEGYTRWGTQIFNRLDGMFALAIFDTQSDSLVLARDRLGEKPLYVARATDGVIAFASEFKSLLTLPGLSHEVSEASLYEYFTLRYVADPNTLYKAIKSVQPGTFQVFQPDGQWAEHNYFAFDLPVERSHIVEQDYLQTLEHALMSAVRTRLVADVPVGAFLSSGVDSALVCGIAAELGTDIRCFSAGFAGSADSETGTSRQIALAYGLPFEEYLVSESDLLDVASNFGAILDEPNGDRSCVPTYFLSQMVRQQVTVALSGDGGDELFGGYGRYPALRNKLSTIPSHLDAVCAYFEKGLPVFPATALRHAYPGCESVFRQRVASRFVSVFARKELDDIERLRLIDLHSYLPGAVLAKVDRMSMHHSLEVRTPFFSPQILALSRELPISLCEQNGLLKVALRKILERYLPNQLIRPDKQGFGMPLTFFNTHARVFNRLVEEADAVLANWDPLRNNPNAFTELQRASRDNINSFWAWIVLGQWTASLA